MTTLVIGDLHHDLPWLNRVLDAERGAFDRVVMLGDYFDAFEPRATAARVCERLLALPGEVGVPVTFLVGNHDYQYAMLAHTPHPPRDAWAVTGGCSGYSKNRAEDIRRVLPAEWWDDCRLAVVEQGWLLSHAGVLPRLWPAMCSVEESLMFDTEEEAVRHEASQLLAEMTHVWRERFANKNHPAFWIGRARGGHDGAGLLWCDFEREFRDALPLPQIVGHTSSRSGARQKGRSWCIDGSQTTYATLTDGEITIKSA